MSRPPGMDAMFRVIQYSEAQHKIYDAVEAAIDENCTVERFIQEARECWRVVLSERSKSDDRAWAKERR